MDDKYEEEELAFRKSIKVDNVVDLLHQITYDSKRKDRNKTYIRQWLNKSESPMEEISGYLDWHLDCITQNPADAPAIMSAIDIVLKKLINNWPDIGDLDELDSLVHRLMNFNIDDLSDVLSTQFGNYRTRVQSMLKEYPTLQEEL